MVFDTIVIGEHKKYVLNCCNLVQSERVSDLFESGIHYLMFGNYKAYNSRNNDKPCDM